MKNRQIRFGYSRLFVVGLGVGLMHLSVATTPSWAFSERSGNSFATKAGGDDGIIKEKIDGEGAAAARTGANTAQGIKDAAANVIGAGTMYKDGSIKVAPGVDSAPKKPPVH